MKLVATPGGFSVWTYSMRMTDLETKLSVKEMQTQMIIRVRKDSGAPDVARGFPYNLNRTIFSQRFKRGVLSRQTKEHPYIPKSLKRHFFSSNNVGDELTNWSRRLEKTDPCSFSGILTIWPGMNVPETNSQSVIALDESDAISTDPMKKVNPIGFIYVESTNFLIGNLTNLIREACPGKSRFLMMQTIDLKTNLRSESNALRII
jgi:hypothetical protein